MNLNLKSPSNFVERYMSIFQTWSFDKILNFLSYSEEITLSQNEFLYKENQPTEHFYIIKQGELALLKELQSSHNRCSSFIENRHSKLQTNEDSPQSQDEQQTPQNKNALQIRNNNNISNHKLCILGQKELIGEEEIILKLKYRQNSIICESQKATILQFKNYKLKELLFTPAIQLNLQLGVKQKQEFIQSRIQEIKSNFARLKNSISLKEIKIKKTQEMQEAEKKNLYKVIQKNTSRIDEIIAQNQGQNEPKIIEDAQLSEIQTNQQQNQQNEEGIRTNYFKIRNAVKCQQQNFRILDKKTKQSVGNEKKQIQQQKTYNIKFKKNRSLIIKQTSPFKNLVDNIYGRYLIQECGHILTGRIQRRMPSNKINNFFSDNCAIKVREKPDSSNITKDQHLNQLQELKDTNFINPTQKISPEEQIKTINNHQQKLINRIFKQIYPIENNQQNDNNQQKLKQSQDAIQKRKISQSFSLKNGQIINKPIDHFNKLLNYDRLNEFYRLAVPKSCTERPQNLLQQQIDDNQITFKEVKPRMLVIQSNDSQITKNQKYFLPTQRIHSTKQIQNKSSYFKSRKNTTFNKECSSESLLDNSNYNFNNNYQDVHNEKTQV